MKQTSSDPSIFVIDVAGAVPVRIEDHVLAIDTKEESSNGVFNKEKYVSWLNENSHIIGERITREIKSKLPPGVDVETTIYFKTGSIEFIAVIEVLDWMARLGSSISFVEYLKKAADWSVKKVVINELRQSTWQLSHAIFEIDGIKVHSTINNNQTQKEKTQTQLTSSNILIPLWLLVVINMVMLVLTYGSSG